MIYKQVIINRLVIDRPKQVRMFQVKLPRQTQSVIGVETGIRWINGVPLAPPPEVLPWKLPTTIQANTYIGDLKLQSTEQGNIFFASDLVLNNNNDYADFTSQYLVPKNYTNQFKTEKDPVMIGGKATVLFGCYKDNLADTILTPFKYIVSVYVWIKLYDNASNQKP